MSSTEDNENKNENDKALMSSKDGDDETMNQNSNNIMKQLNDSLDEIIEIIKISIVLSTIMVIKS